MSKPLDVFISYADGDVDAKWLRALVKSLEAQGTRVQMGDVTFLGERREKSAERYFRKSDVLVSVVSADALNRIYFELGAAAAMQKPLVPILAVGLDPQVLPEPLRSRHFLRQESPEKTAQAVLDQIAAGTVSDT